MLVRRLFRDRAILFVCDIQDKFAPKAYGYQGVLQASIMMIKTANVFGIPIITTEHNKKAFGETCKELKEVLGERNHFIQKTKFSMLTPQTQIILDKYKERDQIIIIGMETHICILQTSLDLKNKNYEVFAMADAITSIRAWQRSIALQRLQNQNIIVSSVQSSMFDILKDSKDQKFKQILQIIKENPREKAISHL